MGSHRSSTYESTVDSWGDVSTNVIKAYDMNTPPQMFGRANILDNPMFDTSLQIMRSDVKQLYKVPMTADSDSFSLQAFIAPIVGHFKQQISAISRDANVNDQAYVEQIASFCTLWRTKIDELIRKSDADEDKKESYSRWADDVVRIYTSPAQVDTELRMMTFATPSQGLKAFLSVIHHSTRVRNGGQEMTLKKSLSELKHSWDVRASVMDPQASAVIAKLESESKVSKHRFWSSSAKAHSESQPTTGGARTISDPWWFSVPRDSYKSTWQTMKQVAMSEFPKSRFSARCAWLTDILSRPPPASADDMRAAVEIISTYGLNRVSVNDTRAIQHQFGPCSASSEKTVEHAPEMLNIERFGALRQILFDISSPRVNEPRTSYKILREHCTVAPHAPGAGSHSQIKYIQQHLIPAFCDTFNLALLKIPEPMQYEIAECAYSRFALSAQGITHKGTSFLVDALPIWREMVALAKRACESNKVEEPLRKCMQYLGFCAKFVWEAPVFEGAKGRWKLAHTCTWVPGAEAVEGLAKGTHSMPYKYWPRMGEKATFEKGSALDALEGLILLTQQDRDFSLYKSAPQNSRRWPREGTTCPELDRITSYLKADGIPPTDVKPDVKDAPGCDMAQALGLLKVHIDGIKKNTIDANRLKQDTIFGDPKKGQPKEEFTGYYIIPGMPDNSSSTGNFAYEIEMTKHDEILLSWNHGYPKDNMMHTVNKVSYYDRLVRSAETLTDISSCNVVRCPYRMVRPNAERDEPSLRPTLLEDSWPIFTDSDI